MIHICYGNGRYSNNVIRSFFAGKISEKQNVYCEFPVKELSELGLSFPKSNVPKPDESTLTKRITLNEKDVEEYYTEVKDCSNTVIDIMDTYCQEPNTIKELSTFLKQPEQKISIIEKNPFKSRYSSNNDVAVHVRLDDIHQYGNRNKPFEFYDNILSKLTFDNAYIASDEISHPICRMLIDKYNMKVIDEDIIRTYQFASTCKYIVISNGSFSWMIGSLGFFSTVFYPLIDNVSTHWHPDFYVDKSWIGS